MKIGFLLNITLLLCFVCSQLLIWLIDGTLVRSMAELLNMQSDVFAGSQSSNGYASTSECGSTGSPADPVRSVGEGIPYLNTAQRYASYSQ